MSSDPPLTVQALDESLKDLVHWEIVATHLLEMTQPQIDTIVRDHSGNNNKQKLIAYDTWLRICPNGTWNNVIQALEKAKEITLAENIKQMLNKSETKESNTEKLTEQIDEGVMTELRRLHKTFERLEKDVEKRCNELVASNEINISDLSRPFARSQYKISGLQDVQTTDQLFESLSHHYTFLDCDKLLTLVEELPNSIDLPPKLSDHKQSVMSFKRATPIRNLQHKLKPYIRQARLNEISLMVIFELEEAWGELDMSLFETFVETMFRGLSNEMRWYKVVPGSLCVTFTAPKDYEEDLISLTKQKLSFIRLMGVIRVKINEKDILHQSEDKRYSFEAALLEASSVGNTEAVSFLLYEMVVSVSHFDENNQSALITAIENNHIEIAQLLLNAKADPNHQRNDGNTPLHIACYKGYTQLAVLLMDFGTNPAITNENGQTPLLSAIRGHMTEVVMMIARQLPKHVISPAILLACRLGYSDIINFLLQYIDPPSSSIHLHCANGDLALAAEHIVQFSEDINSTLVLGITPLMIASSCGHFDVVDCLEQANANVNCNDQDGYSPLAYAITGSKSLPVIQCLLEAGANPSITVGGVSLLQMAKQDDNGDLMDLLLRYTALHLYNMFSSLVGKIQRNLTSEIDTNKVTLQEIKNKLLNDPEFSHIESIAKVSSCSELFTNLQPHYDFLSWKAISLLSNSLKQEGYFKHVEAFESHLQIAMFPKGILLVPKVDILSSSTCSELTLSLDKQWGTKSLFNLRELNTILFSSIARLMSHITVSVTQQEIIVRYKIPKSMKLAERIRSVCSVKQLPSIVLGIIKVSLDSEQVPTIGRLSSSFFNSELAVLYVLINETMPSKDMIKLVKFLFKLYNIDPNISENNKGMTALHSACMIGHLEVVDFLLSKGAHPDIGTNDHVTPLMLASYRGDLDIVKIFVSKCPSAVETANSGGFTPLMCASTSGHTDIVQFLLMNGAQPNMAKNDGWTALAIATLDKRIETVKVLLEGGADPNIVNKNGISVLLVASSNGHTEMIKLLLDYKADYRYSILKQGIPIDSFAAACKNGNIETVHFFQDHGNLGSVSLSLGWYVACLFNCTHLISELVHSLPQLSINQRELVLACVNNNLATVRSNLHHPDIEFVHGVTLLMIACSCGRTSIVKALLDAGASTIKEDEFEKKPIDYCEKNSLILAILGYDKDSSKRTFDKDKLFIDLHLSPSFSKGVPSIHHGFESDIPYVL